MNDPVQYYGEIPVVFDGLRRIVWKPMEAGRAAVQSVWPDQEQRSAMGRRLMRREPVLVVIDHEAPPVALLPEEVPLVAPRLRERLTVDDGMPQLRVEQLDWLPTHLRQAGRRVLNTVRTRMRLTPRPLLPRLVLDCEEGGSVRFAVRTDPRPLSETDLVALVRHLWSSSSSRVERSVERVGAA
ncbi:hypothetical protein [Glycomyces xiaoerkulensis]|uniref:hypothetical protein n=1 Tax=Glycomyces xiaoerkulensis TaxID=2038139 RepID=UPI000C258F57|nr:hypothetical protein [Glycomyces xiaoerkulensis]